MAERIREVRSVVGKTQVEFAQLLGIKQTDLSGYENGRRTFPHKHILTLQNLYNVNPVWLQAGEGEMFIGGAAPAREANEGQRILFAKVGERLATLRAALKLTAAELAQVVGASEADVTAAEKGEKKLTGAQTAKLKNAYPTVNGQWLEHGSGAMLLEAQAPKSIEPEAEPQHNGDELPALKEEDKGFFSFLRPMVEAEMLKHPMFTEANVRIYDIDAHCGIFEYVDVPGEGYDVIVPIPHGVKAEVGFRISGDSMRPRLKSGSFIYCKEIKDWEYISAGEDYIYVVHFRNFICVKFIKQNSLNSEGFLMLQSANPSYESLTVKKEDIRHIWRVVASTDFNP